jgi:hypothetical protein
MEKIVERGKRGKIHSKFRKKIAAQADGRKNIRAS